MLLCCCVDCVVVLTALLCCLRCVERCVDRALWLRALRSLHGVSCCTLCCAVLRCVLYSSALCCFVLVLYIACRVYYIVVLNARVGEHTIEYYTTNL